MIIGQQDRKKIGNKGNRAACRGWFGFPDFLQEHNFWHRL
jgi:hypothetical protein